MVPKVVFLSHLKVPGKSLPLLKPVRLSVSEIESLLFIKGLVEEAEGNPFKGKPGAEPGKKV